MQKKKPEFDIINEVLEACIIAYPVSSFIISLYKQYGDRGFLSKKQLEGLHSKASKIEDINPGKLATLEAMINKMPNRFKSEMPEPKPLYEVDEESGKMIDAILAKYPEHKRVLFLQSKLKNNEPFSQADKADLERFYKVVNK